MKVGGTQQQEDATRPKKGKQIKAFGSGEQALRIVPTILSRPEPTQGQEEKEKCLKKTQERAKRLRVMGHSVNHLMVGESCASTTPIAFTQQDLTT
ncbi:hypothetical protein PanWU01x14_271370, partial [Parasponia andersonii]